MFLCMAGQERVDGNFADAEKLLLWPLHGLQKRYGAWVYDTEYMQDLEAVRRISRYNTTVGNSRRPVLQKSIQVPDFFSQTTGKSKH
jgi:hypothetical protein